MIDGGEEEEEDPGWEYLILAEQAHCWDAGSAHGPWKPSAVNGRYVPESPVNPVEFL